MFIIDVDYVFDQKKYFAVLTCSECDKNRTVEIFIHHASKSGETGIIGDSYAVPSDEMMTICRDSLNEVKEDVNKIINKLRQDIGSVRKKVIESESIEI